MGQRQGRKVKAPLRLRLRASKWCSVAVTALVAVAAAVSYAHSGFSDVDIDATMARRLQYWADPLIPKTAPAGERPTYYNAPAARKVWVIIHIIGIGFTLLGLNTVCDAYFTGALDVMVEKWNIKPDVAGATFMAAGGSAPELFTSLIGACIVENDVGFSTIVGSAVFNVLFVIGLCGLAAQKPIALTWWPLFRDCTFYILGLLMLALFARSPFPVGAITWWEALVLFLFYVMYCVFMYYNEPLEEKVKAQIRKMKGKGGSAKVAPDQEPETEKGGNDKLRTAAGGTEPAKTFAETEAEGGNPPKVQATAPEEAPPETKIEPVETPEEPEKAEDDDEADGDAEEDAIEEMMIKPDGTMNQIIWYMSLPVYVPLYYLTPKPDDRMFLGTFCVSLFWIAFYSFWLVYCVEILGEVVLGWLGESSIIVMGFTLLAAGTSIPDLVSSVAVARAGEGDMAVSSSIGSNIFDILVGLPIPWMLKILVVDPAAGKGTPAIPISGFIVFYVLVLLFMVFMVVLSIHVLGWKLNRCLGLCMGLLYCVFLLIALTVEIINVSDPESMSVLKF